MKTPRWTAAFVIHLAVFGSPFAATRTANSSPDIAVQLSRQDLREQLEENIATGKQALQTARRHTQRWSGELRDRFEAAANDVNATETRLRGSLAQAQNASAAEWEGARAKLAADYEAYARALSETLRIASSVSAAETRDFRARGRGRP